MCISKEKIEHRGLERVWSYSAMKQNILVTLNIDFQTDSFGGEGYKQREIKILNNKMADGRREIRIEWF